MFDRIRSFALAAAAAALVVAGTVAPTVAAPVFGGDGLTGNPQCNVTGSAANSWATIDVLAGATFNSKFDNGDPAGNLCFNFVNTSNSLAAVTFAVATVNQFQSSWGFTGGVQLVSEQLGVLWNVAQGVNSTEVFNFLIAAGDIVYFDWIYGTPYATGLSKPQINFAVTAAVVPLPAAGFLLIGALGGLALLRRRRAAQA